MPTIEDLERQILQLRKEMQANGQTLQALTQKSEKALDTARHAYKVDHYGIIWVWDTEQQGYRKTQMRVCSPEIPNEAITTEKIADGAVTTGKIEERAVKTEQIAPKAVTTSRLAEECITGDELEDEVVKPGKIATDAVQTRNIKDQNVTNEKIKDNDLSWDKLDDDLKQLILTGGGQHGIPLSKDFGDSDMIGITQKTLSEALGDVHKDGEEFVSLQQQIDEIVSGGATVNLVATPSVIFANTTTDITLTASASKNASSINISGGELSEPITGSGIQVSGTDQDINLPIGTLAYLATFIISGLQRTVSRTVSIANKIYYGAGQSDAILNTEAMVFHTPAVAQPSFMQVITTALNDYIYFEVPSEMNNITKLELYDDPSFPTELSLESVATTRTGYKAFKTVNSRLAGTHTYKIS